MPDNRRLRGIRWPWRSEQDLRADVDEELAFHLQMRAAELMAEGMPEPEAYARAEQEFGDVADARNSMLASDLDRQNRRRRGEFLGGIWQDLRFGWRGLLRDRGFAVVALITLALGIGGNSAMFSIVDAVLIRDLPYAEPDRLVAVWPNTTFLRAEYEIARERARSFEQLAGYQGGVGFSLSGDGDAQRVIGARISHNLLSTLGVQHGGGGFSQDDERRAQTDAVLISHGLWRDRYGSDPMLIGKRILIDGAPHTVVGIMPRGFAFPDARTAIWVPLTLDPAQAGAYWGMGGTHAVGRLRPGASAVQAEAELRTLAQEMRTANPLWTPEAPYKMDAVVQPLRDILLGGSRTLLLVLLGAVTLVLLIACANVGNLSLARGLARERELAVRMALGAGRARVVRQLITESALLALIGGAAGIALAWSLLRALVTLVPADTPRLADVQIDARVLAFAFALSILSGLLFGVIPAFRVVGGQLSGSLKEGARGGSSIAKRKLSSAVVIAEVALAVVLVTGAGLLLRTLNNLSRIDTGLTRAQVVSARISPPARSYVDAERRAALFDQVAERVQGLPGVERVALTIQLPFDGEQYQTAAAVEFVTTNPNELPMFDFRAVTAEYFSTLEIPIIEGRAFTSADNADGAAVAIVDRATAERYWPGQSAIGRRIGRPWMREWRTVVGVVGNVRNNDLRQNAANALYVPFAQQPGNAALLVVRSDHSAETIAASIRNAVRDADPNVPVSDIRTLDELIDDASANERSAALLVGAFALLATLLGAVGLYGVLAYAVTQRRRELGIRLALGAQSRALLGMVLGDGLALGAIGLAAGLPAALLLTRLLRGMLFGIEPGNAENLLLVGAVLLATSAAAALFPAWRAARTSPATVLRE